MLQDVLLPPHTAADLTDAVINMAYRLRGRHGDDRTAEVELATTEIFPLGCGPAVQLHPDRLGILAYPHVEGEALGYEGHRSVVGTG